MAGKTGRAPRHLRLLPEWLGQSGLWIADPGDGVFDAIGAEEAGLSEGIADRLEDWMDEFDSIFRDDDPAASCFASTERFSAWRREGEAIARLIQSELGPGDRLEVSLPANLGPK